MAEPNEMAPSQSFLGSNVPSAQEPSKADELREAAHETRDQIRERSQELSTHAQEVASEYYPPRAMLRSLQPWMAERLSPCKRSCPSTSYVVRCPALTFAIIVSWPSSMAL